jgi:hypothetical protein
LGRVLTREAARGAMTMVTIAPVTSTVKGLSSEVPLVDPAVSRAAPASTPPGRSSVGGVTGDEQREKAPAPAEPEVPNAVDEYRRTHPGPWERVLGDVAPGLRVVVNPYEQTNRMIHDFLEVEPTPKDGRRPDDGADADAPRDDD